MSERPPAVAIQIIDDDRVRVTRFTFAPGAETGWHRHEYDYVITAISDCSMQLEEPGNTTRQVDLAAGESYRRSAGVEHNVINLADGTMQFVEVELK